MIKTSADPNAEFMVCCYKDFPRCMSNGGAHAGGYGVRASECPCHVAREAARPLLPQVMIKPDAQ